MSEKIKGHMAVLNTKTGAGKKGPWTLYSCKIILPSGEEYPKWINCGFDEPKFQKGDYIEIEVQENSGRLEYVKGSGRKPKLQPPMPNSKSQAKRYTAQRGEAPAVTRPDGPSLDRRIIEQHSQDMALRLVELLLANKSLPVSAAAGKAGEAKREAELLACVDKYTVYFLRNIETGRLTTTVADPGADGSGVAEAEELPDTEADEEDDSEAIDGMGDDDESL